MFLFNSKLNDCAEWNKHAGKTDKSCKHCIGRILVKLNNGDCTIIPYPTAEERHTWQVYVISGLNPCHS